MPSTREIIDRGYAQAQARAAAGCRPALVAGRLHGEHWLVPDRAATGDDLTALVVVDRRGELACSCDHQHAAWCWHQALVSLAKAGEVAWCNQLSQAAA